MGEPDAGAAHGDYAPVLTAGVQSMFRRIGFALSEAEREGLTIGRPSGDFSVWTGYLCTASGCVLDHVDNYGECCQCNEPAVPVWDPATVQEWATS